MHIKKQESQQAKASVVFVVSPTMLSAQGSIDN